MSQTTEPIPAGFNTISAHLRVRGGDTAIEFYTRAFGAELLHRLMAPDGESVMHAAMRIGNSTLMLSDEFPKWGALSPLSIGGTGLCLHMCVTDIDAAFNRAVAAGAKVTMPPTDMFWGDRYAKLLDPFGHEWSIATRLEDLTPEQMQERGKQAFSKATCPE